MRILPVVCLTAVILNACGGSSGQRASAPVPAANETPQLPDAWSREALDVQPEMAMLQLRSPGATGYKPGTTVWAPLPIDVQAGEASSPGELLMAVISSQHWADVLGEAVWEQTTRVLVDDSGVATGVVLQWGLMDDAVAGRDFRVSMRRTGNRWKSEGVERRFHCRRGVSTDGQCQ